MVEEWYALTTSRSPRTRSGNRSGHLLPTAVVKKQHQTWCMASETHPGHRRWGSEYIPHLLFLGWREGVKGDRKGEGRRGREGEEPKESKENTGSYWGKWSSLLASAKEQRAKDKRTTETKTKDENKDKEQGGQEGRRKASKYDSNHRHTENQGFTGLHAGVFKQARGRWQSTQTGSATNDPSTQHTKVPLLGDKKRCVPKAPAVNPIHKLGIYPLGWLWRPPRAAEKRRPASSHRFPPRAAFGARRPRKTAPSPP